MADQEKNNDKRKHMIWQQRKALNKTSALTQDGVVHALDMTTEISVIVVFLLLLIAQYPYDFAQAEIRKI